LRLSAPSMAKKLMLVGASSSWPAATC
jgi:hypothetical protein